MKKLSPGLILFLISGIILLFVTLPLLAYHFLTVSVPGQNQRHAGGSSKSTNSSGLKVQSSLLISRGVPAYSSSGYDPASNANDDSYDTTWRSQGAPAWLAYDLSSVPAAKRSRVVVVWYNESGNYDHTIINYPTYNMPQDYTIDVNAG